MIRIVMGRTHIEPKPNSFGIPYILSAQNYVKSACLGVCFELNSEQGIEGKGACSHAQKSSFCHGTQALVLSFPSRLRCAKCEPQHRSLFSLGRPPPRGGGEGVQPETQSVTFKKSLTPDPGEVSAPTKKRPGPVSKLRQ